MRKSILSQNLRMIHIAIIGQLRNMMYALLIVMAVVSPSLGAPENLDQLIARKSRQSVNLFYSGEGSNYIWQPQSMSYVDITTGNDVWRMSSTPGVKSMYHNDIALTPWSANGKRMGYMLNMSDTLRVNTSAFTGENGYNVLMLVNTDGSRLRPVVNGPSRSDSHIQWFPWSPVLADTYYMFGRTALGNSGMINDVLYKATVNDTDVSKTAHVDFNTGAEMFIYLNGLSQDGKKVLASQYYSTTGYSNYPATIYPDGSAGLLDADGYSVNIAHDGTQWGDTPATITTYHSKVGPLLLDTTTGKYKYNFLPSGTHTIWNVHLTGSAGDGGPNHTVDRVPPYDFGESVPINAAYAGNNPWPGTHYWSHGCWDRWMRYYLFSDTEVSPISPGVEDTTTHTRYKWAFGTNGVQHNDWHAWSDWFTSARGPSNDPNYLNDRIFTAKYYDESSTKTIAYTHTLYNNNGSYAGAVYEYSAIPRPAQSPDGTKISFHSTFLNSKVGTYDDKPDIFWAVAYYPYPPEIKSAAKNGSNIRLTWDFNQGTAGSPNYINPRTYTKRGWPNETTDRPSSPREIDKFRTWVSTDNSTWSPLGTTIYNNCSGTNECGMWTETAWSFDATQANGTTRYYAVTSLEHSGLESRTLSNVWKVTLDANGNITSQAQQTSYPANPGGKSSFYTTQPKGPVSVESAYMKAPATSAGQYTISWTAPVDTSLIRYYNIYAADGTDPSAIQQNRIASIPASSDYTGSGKFNYIDWLGKPDGSTNYLVTAVDYQGNESPSAGAIRSPSGLKATPIVK